MPGSRFFDLFSVKQARNLIRGTKAARQAVVAGDAAPHAVAGSGALPGSLNAWFWAIVGIPTLLAAVYLFGIASDLYASQVKYLVRASAQWQVTQPSTTPGTLNNPSAIVSGLGATAASQDAQAVREFLLSRDAVRRLEREDDLRAILSRPEGDLISRFPGIRSLWREDFEALYKAYQRFVSVDIDSSNGISTLEVKAYRPEDAQRIAQALMRYSEELVNRLNQRAQQDSLGLLQREVEGSEQRIAGIRKELAAYRVKENMLDPITSATGPMKLLGQMNGVLADARAQLAEAIKNAPGSPQIPLIRTRIAALEKLIEEERNNMTGETGSVATVATEYERLELKRLFAQKQLESIFASREAARIDLERQELFLDVVAKPNFPDYPIYPWRFVSFGIVIAACVLLYAAAWAFVPGLREDRAIA